VANVEVTTCGGGSRPVTVRIAPVVAAGASEGEALLSLATLLRAHASQIETLAAEVSDEAALVGAAAAIGMQA
jgi:uncharacterized protein YoaH (UPF0181 family)